MLLKDNFKCLQYRFRITQRESWQKKSCRKPAGLQCKGFYWKKTGFFYAYLGWAKRSKVEERENYNPLPFVWNYPCFPNPRWYSSNQNNHSVKLEHSKCWPKLLTVGTFVAALMCQLLQHSVSMIY